MMREIKFRAWGHHHYEYNDDSEPTPSDDNSMIFFGIFNSLDERHVDPGNLKIMQYTGLKVFDEIEVYEGDKLSFVVFDCFGNDKSYEGYVVYDGSRFLLWSRPDYEFYGDDGGFDLDWVLSQDDEAKVIGNIYEHKNLIKNKD